MIPYAQSSLRAVASDADRGTESPAHSALSKTNGDLDAVRQVLTDIINGSPILAVGPQNVAQ